MTKIEKKIADIERRMLVLEDRLRNLAAPIHVTSSGTGWTGSGNDGCCGGKKK